jgi:hypothetical protein
MGLFRYQGEAKPALRAFLIWTITDFDDDSD